jgi:P-type Ca2+ transporter type 2C
MPPALHEPLEAPAATARPGLGHAEAAARLATCGRNELPAPGRRSFLRVIVDVVREPMFLLLLASTAIYLTFGDVREAATLGVFVVVVITITIVQERRTERALDALRDLSSPRATVLRDGAWIDLDARLLVPGDLVRLAEGDRVPADAHLCTGTPMTVDESLLTGESVPVVKLPAGDPVFAGTLVAGGHGTAEIVATGPRSELGRIGAALGGLAPARTTLERQVQTLITRIAIIAVTLSAALVVVRGVADGGWRHAALSGITLAMALLPEELPVILTVFLALGAWRIARHRVLTRRPSAVETLGEVTVLCVDKTGTLTQNRMTVRRLRTAARELDVEVGGAALPDDARALVELGAAACPRDPTDPMDRALAGLAGDRWAAAQARWTPVHEYAMRAGLLAVTHVWRDEHGRVVVAAKGAPEAILELCHLDPADAASWRARAEAMAADGLRVLGVAHASHAGDPPDDAHAFAFELAGLIGLADPLRASTADTIARCRRAGIRIVMITGDHPATARAIARDAGIAADDVATGAELEGLDDAALAARLARVDVIARARPAHKLRIVQALRGRGEVVGMTGDGVNDAPALEAADIGVAMGRRGTDVAREAAALVLIDDDLGAIVTAVRIGRRIYDNIRKAIGYTLAVHVPIAGLALLPPLFGWGALLAPIHVVFLELLIDPTCSIVFEMEPEDADVMTRPPRRPGAPIFDLRRLGFSLLQGALALGAALGIVAWGRGAGLAPDAVRALGFVALVAGNLAILIANRGGSAAFWRARARNHAASILIAGAVSLIAITLAVPAVRGLFGFVLPATSMLALAALAGGGPVLAADLLKGR